MKKSQYIRPFPVVGQAIHQTLVTKVLSGLAVEASIALAKSAASLTAYLPNSKTEELSKRFEDETSIEEHQLIAQFLDHLDFQDDSLELEAAKWPDSKYVWWPIVRDLYESIWRHLRSTFSDDDISFFGLAVDAKHSTEVQDPNADYFGVETKRRSIDSKLKKPQKAG